MRMTRHWLNPLKTAGLAFGLVSHTVFACERFDAPHVLVEQKGATLAIQLVPTELSVGQLFSIDVSLCDHNGRAIDGRLDAKAIMPAHNHGMNYQPRFTRRAPGRYQGTGFVFHMPGTWRLILDAVTESQDYTFEYDFKL